MLGFQHRVWTIQYMKGVHDVALNVKYQIISSIQSIQLTIKKNVIVYQLYILARLVRC